MNFCAIHYRSICPLFFVLFLFTNIPDTRAQYGHSTQRDTLTNSVLIYPVIEAKENFLVSTEHTHKSQLRLGDQLARDFVVEKLTDEGFTQLFKTNGSTNSDWYGWRKDVLAPISGTVKRVKDPDTTNRPGTMNRDAQPGLIFFENDNLTVIYAHVREIDVQKGDHVEAGEAVAKVGNNGNSRNPHIHVGAWKDETPLQIQVDLYAEKRSESESK